MVSLFAGDPFLIHQLSRVQGKKTKDQQDGSTQDQIDREAAAAAEAEARAAAEHDRQARERQRQRDAAAAKRTGNPNAGPSQIAVTAHHVPFELDPYGLPSPLGEKPAWDGALPEPWEISNEIDILFARLMM